MCNGAPITLNRSAPSRSVVSSIWLFLPRRSGPRPEAATLSQAPIDELFEVPQRTNGAVVVKRKDLHHLDAADVPDGIDPEFGVEDAGPAHAAWTPEFRVALVFRGDLETEPELVVAGAERKRPGPQRIGVWLLLDENRADLILAHRAHRLFTEQPGGSELSAV